MTLAGSTVLRAAHNDASARRALRAAVVRAHLRARRRFVSVDVSAVDMAAARDAYAAADSPSAPAGSGAERAAPPPRLASDTHRFRALRNGGGNGATSSGGARASGSGSGLARLSLSRPGTTATTTTSQQKRRGARSAPHSCNGGGDNAARRPILRQPGSTLAHTPRRKRHTRTVSFAPGAHPGDTDYVSAHKPASAPRTQLCMPASPSSSSSSSSSSSKGDAFALHALRAGPVAALYAAWLLVCVCVALARAAVGAAGEAAGVVAATAGATATRRAQ